MVLRHAAPPVTIWIDNASVVDGYRKGKSWCISSSRPAADLWDLIWRKVEDLGQGDILVEKVKGHASSADIENGTSSLLHMAGNDHADYFAKKGSALAEHLSSTSTLRQTDQLAKLWYSWLAVLISNWPKDTQGRNQTARKKKRARPAAPDNVAKAAKVDTNKFGVGHRLFRSGELVWCNICGAYAVQRFKALKLPCAGAAGKGPRAGQLARMLKGDHPLQRGVRLPLAVRLSGGGAGLRPFLICGSSWGLRGVLLASSCVSRWPSGAVRVAPGCAWWLSGGSRGSLWALRGRSREMTWASVLPTSSFRGCLGTPGCSSCAPGVAWASLGRLWGLPLGAPGVSLGSPTADRNADRSRPWFLSAFLSALGGPWGPLWAPLGVSGASLWGPLGRPWAAPGAA